MLVVGGVVDDVVGIEPVLVVEAEVDRLPVPDETL